MSILLSVFSLLALSSFATEPVKGGEIDLEASQIEWVGKKVTGQHTGTIQIKSGSLDMSNGKISGGMFEIDMTSIEVTDLSGNMKGKLEGHLSSDDFFGVGNFPTATVKITEASKMEDNQYGITADLTIKGITHPVSFTATVSDNQAMADITVDRAKYDIRYGSGSFFDGLGDKMIYDNFDLSVKLVMK